MYLEMPEPGSRSVPFLLNASSLSWGLSKSILVGLRGRGEWKSVLPLLAFASKDVDSAIMRRRVCACHGGEVGRRIQSVDRPDYDPQLTGSLAVSDGAVSSRRGFRTTARHKQVMER